MLLEVEGLTKHFGGITAVKEVCFQIKESEILALIGPNGAGKTTVFNLITGMLKPDSGSVIFEGKTLTGLKPHRIAAAGLTRTFQNLQLFGGMTVLENIMAGAYLKGQAGFLKSLTTWPGTAREEKKIRQEALVLMQEVGLTGLEDLPAAALPFGRQRLLEIARALASEPRLVLLDEPAAGLNSAETKELAGYLLRLRKQGKTLLLVEHDMETVMEVADRILVLNFGEVIALGKPAEIQANPEVIKAYLGEDEQVA
ncbi:MAG: Lipopolysaccharide export system ATP-binding protein LptB [Firmicutes bacterium ADurb.Bin456]|nr:MAG: Lipopolysaccharide export system ATP-binding protein LptB [Firmicutes bacterium ADurb.Bin456]